MPELLIIGLGLALLLTFCGLTWFILNKFKQLKNQLSESDDVMRQTLEKLAQLDDELHEIRSGNQALGKKIKELIVSINGLDDKQQKLAEHDPQSRFYQKAAKLIADGATLNDVMQECDLPRAEAELLFSLHQR